MRIVLWQVPLTGEMLQDEDCALALPTLLGEPRLLPRNSAQLGEQ